MNGALRVLLVHNDYAGFGGEEAVLRDTISLLERKGHHVAVFRRSSVDIAHVFLGQVRAFLSGIYSLSSRQEMKRLLRLQRPDVVQVQNLYPWISPSVLLECRYEGVPVVMTVHNYRLVCPWSLLLSNGRICKRCFGGKEFWCVLKNCTGNLLKSIGYAARSYFARKLRMFADNVTLYAPLTEFQRDILCCDGYPAERMVVLPNMCAVVPGSDDDYPGEYVGYAGRISPEKGIDVLIKAARSLPEVPFRLAGSYNRMPHLPDICPDNVRSVGHLGGDALDTFYRGARICVLPSVCYETFGLVIAEAMMRGKAIVCSRIGGLPEIVEDGVTGLLFEPGNATDLAEKIAYLWERPQLCRQLGRAGREKALRDYSPEKYYERLIAVYEKAIALGPGGPGTA